MAAMRAEYVAPAGFGQRAWFAPERPGVRWFYHQPRGARPPPHPDVLDATLDAPLVGLVRWARAHGISTGPSCAGHSLSPRAAALIFEGLRHDERLVRGPGLVLRDVETGERWRWRRPDYRAPFASARAVEAALLPHARDGLLPLQGPAQGLRRILDAAVGIPYLTTVMDKSRLSVHVRAPTQARQDRAWLCLTQRLVS